MEGLATSREVAEYLNISHRTLNNWVPLGKGPAYVKIEGGARRYDWADVKSWVEAQKVRH